MAQNRGRGFAAMDPEEQREIASEGGTAAHEKGTAHEWDNEEAAEAGRKGGMASHHREAAFYHESAAHHHRQAAGAHERGESDEAERHGDMAHSHSTTAHGHSQRSRRGFASMDPEEQREIARKGGRASQGRRNGRGEYEDSQGSSKRTQRADDDEENQGNGDYMGDEEMEGDDQSSGHQRGGTSEQHAKAGRQSRKNRR